MFPLLDKDKPNNYFMSGNFPIKCNPETFGQFRKGHAGTFLLK